MNYDKNNIFAKIIRGDIPADKIYEDEHVLAFNDISQAAPTHALVIPKGEYVDFSDFVLNSQPGESVHFFRKVSEIAKQIGANEEGFRLIANSGPNAHQTVNHFHIHILAGKKLGPLISTDNKLR